MKKIIPEIYVDNCKEALDYYKDVFGGEIKNVQTANGKEMFKGMEGKIIHSELHLNQDCVMYLMDILDRSEEPPHNHLLLEFESEEEIRRVYEALIQKGSVKYELQKAFWGAYHAVVIDCFGQTWGLNYTIG